MSETITITIESGPSCTARAGALLSDVLLDALDALGDSATRLPTPCGGAGTCCQCRVQILSGVCAPSEHGLRFFSDEQVRDGWRLACRVRAEEDLTVHLPGGHDEIAIATESIHRVLANYSDCSAGLVVGVDVGTTTLAAELVDAQTQTTLAVVSRANPQRRFGDDVVSRLAAAMEPGGDALTQLIQRAIDEMIDELMTGANRNRDELSRIALCGNSAMNHLLCGWDVESLATLPFDPSHPAAATLRAGDIGLRGDAEIYIAANIGGYIGGDITAGLLATSLASHTKAMFIDVGTNGEIVIVSNGEFFAASAAAGPALEGARISCGIQATTGAIDRVEISGDALRVHSLGEPAPATGICGSGLIDAMACGLGLGQIDTTGRLDGETLALTPAVALTQKDIREVQLAVGAIRAATGALLGKASLAPGDLETVYLAGGFGQFIDPASAIRIGLLPEVDLDRVVAAGNTSLAGAVALAASATAREESETLAERVQHVELGNDMNFQMAFAEAMIFPG